jgi:hypothetical protein
MFVCQDGLCYTFVVNTTNIDTINACQYERAGLVGNTRVSYSEVLRSYLCPMTVYLD